MVRVGINASFIRKAGSGIGQVSFHFLKKLIQIDKAEQGKGGHREWMIYLEEDLPRDFILPDNFHPVVHKPFWKRDDLIRKIIWEKFWLPRRAERDGCQTFFSLYQSPTIMPDNISHLMLVHDIIPDLFPEYLNNSRKKLYWSLTKQGIIHSDKIIAVSSRTEKDLIKIMGIDPQKIAVGYIDCDEIYKREVSSEKTAYTMKKYNLDPGYIYNGGGLEMRKNVEGVILAYKYLWESNKRENFIREMPKLVISGKLLPHLAPLVTDVKKIIKELDLTSQVEILDFVPQNDLPAIYNQAIFFIYPSHYEGFGIPVLEAMASGCPVITSKKSSLPEVGLDSVLYCNSAEVRDMAMVMKNLMLNSKLRNELRRRGRERASAFSWNRFVEKILHQIDSFS